MTKILLSKWLERRIARVDSPYGETAHWVLSPSQELAGKSFQLSMILLPVQTQPGQFLAKLLEDPALKVTSRRSVTEATHSSC